MAKVGYIFKADRYDGLEADKEWMEKYGCVQVIEESVDNEALRPKWKQLVANLERGDEEVVAVLRYSSAHVMNLQQKANGPKKTMKAMDKADRENTIVDMYVNGHSFEDIMAVSGYNSRSSVFSVLNKHGVELNRGKFKGPLGKRKPKDGQ